MEMNKWFGTVCAVATGASLVPVYLAAQQKPHIILIVSDQHRGRCDALHGQFFCNHSQPGRFGR